MDRKLSLQKKLELKGLKKKRQAEEDPLASDEDQAEAAQEEPLGLSIVQGKKGAENDQAKKRKQEEVQEETSESDEEEDEEDDEDEDQREEDAEEYEEDGEEVGHDDLLHRSEYASVPRDSKQKVLVFSSRGIIYRHRHLMNDIKALLPHSKKEAKFDTKNHLYMINELCEMQSCNNCIFFETRKHEDLYLWMSKSPQGPSAKFHVSNVHSMNELKLTGNCLKGSRPLLAFDRTFDTEPVYQLLKELFIQIFSTPKGHPKSKPFVDHTLSFTIADNKIWFRHYQIQECLEEKGGDPNLVEIGPRFVMNLVRVFQGSFGGATLYENPHYVSPNKIRSNRKKELQERFKSKVKKSVDRQVLREEYELSEDELEEMFRK